MLRHLLELSGHEVHEAADGVRGLEQALVLHPTPSSSISVFPVWMAIRSPSASGPRAAETWSSSR